MSTNSTKTKNRTSTSRTTEFADLLRQAIRDSGLNTHRLAKLSGVPQPTIYRFLHGADMKISTVGKLLEVAEIMGKIKTELPSRGRNRSRTGRSRQTAPARRRSR